MISLSGSWKIFMRYNIMIEKKMNYGVFNDIEPQNELQGQILKDTGDKYI